MSRTNIQWTQLPGTIGESWNPVVGCKEKGRDCINCYARNMAPRLVSMGQEPYEGLTKVKYSVFGKRLVYWTGEVAMRSDKLEYPLHCIKPRTFFVVSMGDPFYEKVTPGFLDYMHAVMMATASRHHYIMLTKYVENARAYYANRPEKRIARLLERGFEHQPKFSLENTVEWPLPNLWLVMSAGYQRELEARWKDFRECPATVLGLSAEPMVEALRLTDDMKARLQWIIIGGESGRRARPFLTAAAVALRGQAEEAGIPVFLKQLGSKPVDGRGERIKLHSSHGSDPGEWPESLRVRDFPRSVNGVAIP